MRIKKILIILLALTLLLATFAGCKADNNDSNSTTGETTTNNTSKENDESEAKEAVTFTYFMSSAASATSPERLSESKIGKMISDATGVDLEFEYVVGDVTQKVGVMTAGGDYPDLIMGAGGFTDEFVNAKALIPLNDYLDNYPNLKQLYEPYYNSMREPSDGNIYYLPMAALIGEKKPITNLSGYYAFNLQRRVIEALDYPELNTVDDFFVVIKQYLELYPETDGEANIGFEVLNHEWRDNLTWAYEMASGFVDNVAYDAMVQVDYEKKEVAGLKSNSEGYYRMAKIFNRAFNDGLISEESLIQTYDQYVAKIASGRVIGLMDADWDYQTAEAALIQAGMEDRTYIQFALTFDEGVEKVPAIRPYPNNEGLGISVTATNVEQILEFLDYIASEETQKMRRWGIEGEDYTIGADGLFTRTIEQHERALRDNEYMKSQGINTLVYGFPYADGVWEDGNTCDPAQQTEIVLSTFSDFQKTVNEEYGWTLPSDQLNLEVVDAKWAPTWSINLGDGSDAKVYQAAAYEIDTKWRNKLITVTPDQYDSTWQQFQEELAKLDPQPFIDAINEAIKYREDNR